MDTISRELSDFGLSVDGLIADGEIHRCHSGAKERRNKDGWYSIKEHNGKFYCVYGCWVRGDQGRCSSDGAGSTVNNSEVWELLEAERKKQQEIWSVETKNRAFKFVSDCPMCAGVHKYLKKKKVQPYGVLQRGNQLIVPVYNPNGEVSSYQLIGETGAKKFMPGGMVGGCCYPIKGNDSVVCVCEGFATGASIHEATGYKVLVAFNAGNIGKVAKSAVEQFPNSNILICADNDHKKPENIGLVAGKKASDELNIQCVWPTDIDGSDFNDMADELGLSEVTDAIIKGRVLELYQTKKKEHRFDFLENPPGTLKDIAAYYNETAIKPQPLFALATGLILGSIVLGRRYTTGGLNNYTSAYFLLVAKSGTGKDHPKTLVRDLLRKSGLTWMEKAGGYTASNTIMKSLERQPLQISFFEEIGQKLNEASKNSRSMATGVFRQMLDIWSSCHSLTIGEEYSDGTVPTVHRPALTFVGITTPRELFRAINESLIEQGFVNRLLAFISDEDRKASKLNVMDDTSYTDVLEHKICNWIKKYGPVDPGILGVVIDPPCEEFLKNPCGGETIEIPFTSDAIDYLNLVEEDLIRDADNLEKHRLDDMLSRVREITMRISLTVAVMDEKDQISLDHVKWSYLVVNSLFNGLIDEIKRSVSGSEFEEMKLEALTALRLAGSKGIKPGDMPKVSPFAKWTKKERVEILADLQDSELVDKMKVKTGKRGPGTMVWVALK